MLSLWRRLLLRNLTIERKVNVEKRFRILDKKGIIEGYINIKMHRLILIRGRVVANWDQDPAVQPTHCTTRWTHLI